MKVLGTKLKNKQMHLQPFWNFVPRISNESQSNIWLIMNWNILKIGAKDLKSISQRDIQVVI